MNRPMGEHEPTSVRQNRSALVLGAASPLGAAVLLHLKRVGGVLPIVADLRERRDSLLALVSELGYGKGEIEIATLDPGKIAFGFEGSFLRRIKESTQWVFHLAHTRDRTLPVSEVGHTNRVLLEQVLSLGRKVKDLKSIVIVTDVGLCGDFPGKFSENWIDVGQIPFDEVDRSSREVEIVCSQDSQLPIVRARVGLLSDLEELSALAGHWRPAAQVLLSSIKLFKKLPNFINISTAVAKGSLAPLTPTDWAGQAIVHLSTNPEAVGKAVHLVISPPPSMEKVLDSLSKQVGGAKIRGGLPVGLIKVFGIIPGMMETVRRQADHIASWWTPHRYCLSRNELDTTTAEELLPESMFPPTWWETKAVFFRQPC